MNDMLIAGSGWPAFHQSIHGAVSRYVDNSGGMERIECVCSNCDSHLGHVFKDETAATGER
jgi:peptide methionine sulfoxide reductase MsrB